MALGNVIEEGEGNGDTFDRLKFNAKEGKYFHSYYDRENSSKEEEEFTDNFRAIVDFDDIDGGWADFSGSEPSVITVKLPNQLPNKPSDDHKKYANVKLYNSKFGVVNFGSSAQSVLQKIDELHDAYTKANKKELLPLVHFNGVTEPKRFGKGTVKLPIFEIVGWKSREEMETVIGKQTEPKKETAPVKEESAAKKDLDDLSSAFGDDDF